MRRRKVCLLDAGKRPRESKTLLGCRKSDNRWRGANTWRWFVNMGLQISAPSKERDRDLKYLGNR